MTWNNQVFNQGAPKPGGSLPGKTSALRGTIDPTNGSFVIEWTSQIVGGPFDNFTGLWHLAGQYQGALPTQPAALPVQPAVQPAAPAAPVPGTPEAPAAPVPGTAEPVQQPQPARATTVADTTLASRTIDVPRDRELPVWLVPTLILGGLVGVGVFFGADRIAGSRRA